MTYHSLLITYSCYVYQYEYGSKFKCFTTLTMFQSLYNFTQINVWFTLCLVLTEFDYEQQKLIYLETTDINTYSLIF